MAAAAPSERREPALVSLEVFILNQLSTIAQETSGRAQAQRDVREAALKLLEELGVADFGKPGSRLSLPFPPEISTQLLSVLRGALALGNPRLAEPALSCMHKLVAYAYMQGETGPSGRLDDEANLVTQVVALTSKCGESSSPATQLQVVKALLTYATAEHFMAHGDCLMQAVRTVFNIAIGSESAEIQNTARSALLQMVNTVLKRVGQQILSPHGTPLPSPSPTMFRPWRPTGSSDNVAAAATTAAVATALGPDRTGSTAASASSSTAVSAVPSEADLAAAGPQGSDMALPSPSQPLSPAENDQLMEALSAELSVAAPVASCNSSPPEVAAAGRRTTSAGRVGTSGQPGSATNSSTGVAEAADALAAAADIAELQAALPRIQTSPEGTAGVPALAQSGDAAGSAEQFVAAAVEADARTAQLASLAEQADLRGLERALDSLPQTEPVGRPTIKLQRQDTPPDPRRALMRDRRAAAWKLLTPVERDALIVLTAMCKMAARETGLGTVESYMHKGKLLALDLLVRVLTNPMHDWALVRPEFAGELRQPLCLVLLRNCSSPYEAAVTAAVRLFEAVLSAQKLRAGLKAELGALYPLLLLKPIETMPGPEGAHAVAMAAEGLLHTCSHPQVLVDLFVNYDCSLQAANLYERSIKAIRKLMALPEGATAPFPPAAMQKLKATALKALLAAIQSLDTWAGPIKSAAAAVALTVAGGGTAGPGRDEPNGSGEGELAEQPRGREELQRILADKELKEALTAGVELFNASAVKGLRALVRSGVIPDNSPAAAAAFLREHTARLDKGQVGELFGHHDDHSIAVMHAYIDGEQFSGLSLDEALRQLLQGFRLPGEAQKIDRIMEKFAEAYCRDNPTAFKTADGAYLLAFAIIMLNTDAHNPMADRRISADDFVAMAQCQVEGGGGEGGSGEGGEDQFEQILPTEELLAIYTRITENEIKLHGEDDAAPAAAASVGKRGGDRNRRGARLAAAVGVSQMVLPFWAGATWDKQHGVDVERKRLLEFTRQMMASNGAAVAGNIWHTATHAEHARPMMQVSGDAFLHCLKLALDAAPNMHQALQVLGGYEQAVRLAALLRLEGLCEALVAGLAAAAGLSAPAPHSSAAEAKQVAALSKLVSLGSCSEAGMLGPSWLILLRTLSQLERLQAQLLPGSKDGLPPLPEGVAALMASSSLDAVAAATAAAAAAAAAPLPPPPQAGSSFGRLLQRMGFSSGTEGGSSSDAASRAAAASGRAGLLAIKDAPGAGHVLWAETAGVAPIERIYSGSAGLAGDAVLSFMRALCAVSQEELHPAEPGERPRVSLLQRVVECAYHNMGSRIRLIWSRLWNVVQQHLVSAACHTDAHVAMYAVDALRQLTAKLLDRAELARFTHQGEALRPFAAVLRHSDSPAVRELAVACMAHAVSAHPRGLGSGWRAVVEVLGLAARDASPTVAGQALDALAPVAEALFRPAGHTLLWESTAAVLAGVENPHGHEELSIGALYLFQALARRLDEALLSGAVDEVALSLGSAEGLRSPMQGERQALPAAVTATAAAAGGAAQDPAQGQERGRSASQPAELPLAASSSARTDLSFSVWRSSSQPLSQPDSATSGAGGDQQLAAAAVLQQQQGQPVDQGTAAWQVLLVPLAAVARVDVRPRVADTAAAVLLQLLKLHGDGLTPQQWLHVYQAVLQPLLALPADASAAGVRLDGTHLPLAGSATPTALAAANASTASALAGAAGGEGSFLEAGRHTTTGGSPVEGLPAAVPSVLSFEGLDRLERHASAHMPEIWQFLLEAAEPEAGEADAAGGEANGADPPSLQRGGGSGGGSSSLAASVLQLHRSLSGASSAGSAAAGSSPTAAAARGRLPLLWQPLLGLLQQYIFFPAESTAVLGVNQLHNLLLAAAPALDAYAWQAAFVMLQTICLQDPWTAPSAAGPPASSLGGSGTSSGVPASLLVAAAAADSLRRRSRMAVLLQRVLDNLLQQRAAAMPGQVQLQLLELLHRTVLVAATLNADVAQRMAAEHALLAGAAAAEQAHLASQTSALLRQLTGGGEAWGAATSVAATTGGAGEAPPAGLAPAAPVADADELAGGSSSGAGWELTLPALVRQEVEGGCLYIAALQRCVMAPTSSNGTEAAVAAESEARLANFCLWVVAGAAERATALGGGEGGAVDPTAAAAAAAADVPASPGPAPAAAGAINPADQPWEDALRAPLVDAALQAYAGLSSAVWARQQAAAFPHLARLVCSPSKGVRRALRALLQQQVPSVLAAVQAGPGGAGSGGGAMQ